MKATNDGTNGASKRKTVDKKVKDTSAEREHYRKLIDANEERLRSGLTANGTPMTPEQIATTQQVVEKQKEKLASF